MRLGLRGRRRRALLFVVTVSTTTANGASVFLGQSQCRFTQDKGNQLVVDSRDDHSKSSSPCPLHCESPVLATVGALFPIAV